MLVPQNQEFVPVILGGDIGAYSLARSFHQEYGSVSVVVSKLGPAVVTDSAIIESDPCAGMDDNEILAAHLRNIAARFTGRQLLLLGSADPLVRQIIQVRESLNGAFITPYVDLDTFDAAVKKEKFSELCEKHQVAHPKTVVYDVNDHRGEAITLGLKYPVIAKASNAASWEAIHFDGQMKVHTVASSADLTKLFDHMYAAGYRDKFVLQDMIPGDDQGMRILTMYSNQAGKVVFAAYGRVLLEEHSPGALGNPAGIVNEVNTEVVAQVTRLVEDIGWVGYSNFDIKYDPRDGSDVVFELNPRLGRSNFYITGSGFNAVRYYVDEYLRGQTIDVPASGPLIADRENLYTVLPHHLLLRYVTDPVTRLRVKSLIKRRASVNPLLYKVEKSPKRWWYILLSSVNYYRKFARFYPVKKS